MAQLAPITVDDGQATPVSHTYIPVGKPAGSDWDFFVERVNGSPEFENELRLRTRFPMNPAQPLRVDLHGLDVVTKTVDGSPEEDFRNRINIEGIFARNSTSAARKDLRIKLANALLNDAKIIAAIDDLESTY